MPKAKQSPAPGDGPSRASASGPAAMGPDAAAQAAFAKLKQNFYKAMQSEESTRHLSEGFCQKVEQLYDICSRMLGWCPDTEESQRRMWRLLIMRVSNILTGMAESLPRPQLTNLLFLFVRRAVLLTGIHRAAFDSLMRQHKPQESETLFCIAILDKCLGYEEDTSAKGLGKFSRDESILPEPWQRYENLAYMHWHPKPIMLDCKLLTTEGELWEPEAIITCRNFLLRLLVPGGELPAKPANIYIKEPFMKYCDGVIRNNECMRALFELLEHPAHDLCVAPLLDAMTNPTSASPYDHRTSPLVINMDTDRLKPYTLRHMLSNGAARPLTLALNNYRIEAEREQLFGGINLREAYNDSHPKGTAAAVMCALCRIVQKAASAEKLVYSPSVDSPPEPAWPEELLEAYLRSFMKAMEFDLFRPAVVLIIPRASLPKAAQVFKTFPVLLGILMKHLMQCSSALTCSPPHFREYGIFVQFLHDLLAAGHGTGAEWCITSFQAQDTISACTSSMTTLAGMLHKCEQGQAQPALKAQSERGSVVEMMSKTLMLLIRFLSLSRHARDQFLKQSALHASWAAAVRDAGLQQCGFDYEASLARNQSVHKVGVPGALHGSQLPQHLDRQPFSAWFASAQEGAESGAVGAGGRSSVDGGSAAAEGGSRGGMPSSSGNGSGVREGSIDCGVAGAEGGSRGTMPKSSSSGSNAKPDRVCASCGKGGKLKVCGRCGAAYFCGVECQKSAWPSHRRVCVPKADC